MVTERQIPFERVRPRRLVGEIEDLLRVPERCGEIAALACLTRQLQ